MKTDVENQSEVGGIYLLGTLDTTYPIWQSGRLLFQDPGSAGALESFENLRPQSWKGHGSFVPSLPRAAYFPFSRPLRAVKLK